MAASSSRATDGDGAKLSLREQQKRFTRERLIQSALAVIEEKGYAAATIDDIVAAAGASRATFYLHFKNKLELMQGLLDVLAASGLEKWIRLAEMDQPTWKQLRAWIVDDVLPYYEQNRALIAAVDQAVATEPELASGEVATRLERVIEALGDFLDTWPGFTRDQARIRCVMVMLEIDRFCILWIVHGAEYDHDAVVDALADSWWASLNPPPRQAPPARPKTRARAKAKG